MTHAEKTRIFAKYLSTQGNVSKNDPDYALLDQLFEVFTSSFARESKLDTSPNKEVALQKAYEALVSYWYCDTGI